MSVIPPSSKEVAFIDLERELKVTRAVLERLPAEHYGWKPHEKSMNLGQLALHVATLPDWARVSLAQDELDAATAPRPPKTLESREQLLEIFDRSAAGLQSAAEQFDMATYNKPWSMRNGAKVMVTRPKSLVYRVWSINHLIHHRAQLCLYLRLLNVAVPTVYFNTADDPTWVFE
ncbi:MAG: DinB family protein [Planctomycetota bacterium]|nr:DinB family protein [Planctomycetota bacterium]